MDSINETLVDISAYTSTKRNARRHLYRRIWENGSPAIRAKGRLDQACLSD